MRSRLSLVFFASTCAERLKRAARNDLPLTRPLNAHERRRATISTERVPEIEDNSP